MAEPSFRFTPEEHQLFVQIMNEVLNGFAVPDFEHAIGLSKAEMTGLLRRTLSTADNEELGLSKSEARAVRNALRKTLQELGVEGFQTRTGHDFDRGKAMLARLEALVAN